MDRLASFGSSEVAVASKDILVNPTVTSYPSSMIISSSYKLFIALDEMIMAAGDFGITNSLLY